MIATMDTAAHYTTGTMSVSVFYADSDMSGDTCSYDIYDINTLPWCSLPGYITGGNLPLWVQFILWMAFRNCERLVAMRTPSILKVSITQHDYG
jgi:hypothetical protein